MSVAALMLSANPSLDPDELGRALHHRSVALSLPGCYDGSGILDPVEAVKLAVMI
jgi:hypothetical protein